MKLALDVDNVLADTIACLCVKAAAYLGSNVSKDSIKSPKIVGSVQIAPREIFRLLDEVWREWESLPATEPNISRKIAGLTDNGFEIHIVTQRPSRSIEFVRNWLSMMEIGFDYLHSIGPYKSKTEVDVDALIDDDSDEIRKFLKTGRLGFLYVQPWNENSNILGAVNIKSIVEVLRHLQHFGSRG